MGTIVGSRICTSPNVGSASNWWEVDGKTTVAAYQAVGAADLATSLVNLANPGVNNLVVNNPGNLSFSTAEGWIFPGLNDGSAPYLSGFPTFDSTDTILILLASASGDPGFNEMVLRSSNIYLGVNNGAFYFEAFAGYWEDYDAGPDFSDIVVGICNESFCANGVDLGTLDPFDAGSDSNLTLGTYSVGTRGYHGPVRAVVQIAGGLTADQLLALSNAMLAL